MAYSRRNSTRTKLGRKTDYMLFEIVAMIPYMRFFNIASLYGYYVKFGGNITTEVCSTLAALQEKLIPHRELRYNDAIFGIRIYY